MQKNKWTKENNKKRSYDIEIKAFGLARSRLWNSILVRLLLLRINKPPYKQQLKAMNTHDVEYLKQKKFNGDSSILIEYIAFYSKSVFSCLYKYILMKSAVRRTLYKSLMNIFINKYKCFSSHLCIDLYLTHFRPIWSKSLSLSSGKKLIRNQSGINLCATNTLEHKIRW